MEWKFKLFLIFLPILLATSLLSFFIYQRTKIRGKLVIAAGSILLSFGLILLIITDNLWIPLTFTITGGIICNIGLGWTSFTEWITRSSVLERLEESRTPLSNIEYIPITRKKGIIGGLIMILIMGTLGYFIFYLFHYPYILLVWLPAVIFYGGTIIILSILHRKQKNK